MIDDFDFSGAHILEARIGPRRELTLEIEIQPKNKHAFRGIVTIRFGAIANYDEVSRYFTAPSFEGLHYLHYVTQPSPGRHIIEMEFDRTEDHVRIVAGKLSFAAKATQPGS